MRWQFSWGSLRGDLPGLFPTPERRGEGCVKGTEVQEARLALDGFDVCRNSQEQPSGFQQDQTDAEARHGAVRRPDHRVAFCEPGLGREDEREKAQLVESGLLQVGERGGC